jgi:hypothetical protein
MLNDSIEHLLDQLYAAILVADFPKLVELTPLLEASFAGLERPNVALLQRISRKAERNAACLQAAGRGVRAAQRRLTELRQNASGLMTYTGGGKRAEYAAPGPVTRRL